jgi:hypothetical protein
MGDMDREVIARQAAIDAVAARHEWSVDPLLGGPWRTCSRCGYLWLTIGRYPNKGDEPCPETMLPTRDERGGVMTVDAYAALAERAAERALSLMRDGHDASAELSLATAAWSAAMGEASDAVRADLDEYEVTDGGYQLREVRACICPPDLLARGGFRGGCPIHDGVGTP